MAHSCFGVCSVFFPSKSSPLLFLEHWDALPVLAGLRVTRRAPLSLHLVEFSRLFQAEDDFLERNFPKAHLFDLQELDFLVLLN